MQKEEKKLLLQNIRKTIVEAFELDSEDSEKETIIFALANLGERVTKERIKRKTKRQWIKEWRKEKKTRGSFAFLSKELLVQDESSYRNYLRVSKTDFEFLLSLIKNNIQRSNTEMREAIPAEEKLAMTLRFLATGEFYMSLDYQTRLSKASICNIVPEVCNAIYSSLKSTYLKFPNSCTEWEKIAKDFALRWQFPNCLGALDGKHINFRPSRKDGAYYYNYKGTASIVLLALVDANSKFIFVDVGCNGRCNDSSIFLQSKLSGVLQKAEHIPESSEVGRGRKLPYVIVGDDAFPLQKHLLKPYPYHSQCPEKQVFNKRISRASHVVEHAFGMLANRFRVFLAPINLKVETVQSITLACIALHNFLIEKGDTFLESVGTQEQTSNCPSGSSEIPYNPRKGEAENIRKEFMNYFNEEGKLDWYHST